MPYSIVFLFIYPIRSLALTFISFDARSMAMGGIGVASARSYNASLFNPALLSGLSFEKPSTDNFVRPYLGARIIDRDNFIASLDNYQDNDNEKALQQSVDNFNDKVTSATVNSSDLREFSRVGNALLADVQQLSEKPLRVGVSYGLTAGTSRQSWGMGLYSIRYDIDGGIIRFVESDRARLAAALNFTDKLAATLESLPAYVKLLEDNLQSLQLAWISGGNEALLDQLEVLGSSQSPQTDLQNLRDLVNAYEALYSTSGIPIGSVDDLKQVPQLSESLQSSLEVQGAMVNETGISFSKSLDSTLTRTLGFTLKDARYETVDYLAPVNQASRDDLDANEHSRVYNDYNFDLGYSQLLRKNWKLGMMVKNLISRNYLTARGNTIRLRPLARIGAAYGTKSMTLAMDLDITRNEPLGFDPDKRYPALGVELRYWGHNALRAGIRHNLVDNTQLYSLGIGFGFRNGHADVALAGQGDALGLSLQSGIHF